MPSQRTVQRYGIDTIETGALILSLPSMGMAEVKVMKLGLASPPKDWAYNYTPHTVFKEIVESETHGQVKVEIYPSNQLGGAKVLIGSVRKGVVQAACPSTGKLEPHFSKVNLLYLPYLFRNEMVAWKVLDGPFGRQWGEALRKETGLRLLTFGENGGFTNFVTRGKRVRSPEDLKGLKIRTEDVPAMMKLVKALGANPVAIDWPEMYTSLQTGVVDGFEENVVTLFDFNLQEVTRYMVMDRHMYASLAFFVNDKWFRSLAPDQQRVLMQAAKVEAMINRSICRAKEIMLLERARKAKLEIYYPTDQEF
ncbi:MAG: DctP family TRAP transporter solute-binding subunit, partial [Deltaproteobacteria bacterium]|nr:DctP family TRAP transporter solute-binding subunit [Deltaproteobacteria bacterium]